MTLDPTTEAILHFIGAFELQGFGERLRIDYETFDWKNDPDAPWQGTRDVQINIHSPYEVQSFDPVVRYAPPVPDRGALASIEAADPFVPEGPLPDLQAAQPDMPPLMLRAAGPGSGVDVVLLPPPNSIVARIAQSGLLEDNDILGFGLGAKFASLGAAQAQLGAAMTLGNAMGMQSGHIFDTDAVPDAQDALLLAHEMRVRAEADEVDGIESHVMSGDDAQGLYVDGEAAQTMPRYEELLPEPLQDNGNGDMPPGGREAWAATPDDGAAGDSWADQFGGRPGHHVETGANQSVNEALVNSRWVDAPVIAVGGSRLDLTYISQVNVMAGSGAPTASLGVPASESRSVNAASIATASSEPEDAVQDDGAESGTDEPLADARMPNGFALSVIEGDLVANNHVEQNNFITDNDRVEVSFSGSSTQIETGGNTNFNVTSLSELGYHFDLILVGGDMITINAVSQLNVMLDDDTFGGATLSADGGVASGDNLQLNTAQVARTGLDTQAEMGSAFDTALDSVIAGNAGAHHGLLAESDFAGLETVRVLQIEGDFTRVNSIEQNNYLGDSDQVHMAMSAFLQSAAGAATITTGANAQLNSARILESGLDSSVMARGETYSDELIYQAGLAEDEAAPDIGAYSDLASEAVAFLADGMIEPDHETGEDAITASTTTSDSVDLMQTLLA